MTLPAKSVGRRGFLRMLSASPLAARAAAEEAAAKLARVDLSGVSPGSPIGGGPQDLTPDQWSQVLRLPGARRQLESLLFEDERNVGAIDHDLAVYRSFSLAAKIAFQRQRNVQRRLEGMQGNWMWRRLEKVGRSFLGLPTS